MDDSDIEILDEVLPVIGKSSYGRRSSGLSGRENPRAISSDEEPEDVLIMDHQDDDCDSLLSLSPPPPTSNPPKAAASLSSNEYYGSCRVPEVDMNSCHKSDFRSSSTSKSKAGGDTGKGGSLFGGDTKEIYDCFEDVEYSSLTDYLASRSVYKTTSKIISEDLPTVGTTKPVGGNNVKANSSTHRKSNGSKVSVEESRTKPVPNKRKIKDKPVHATSSKENCIQVDKSQQPQPIKKLKAGEANKMMILQIDENVMSDDLATKLLEKELQFKIISDPAVSNSIFFERNVYYNLVGKDLQVHQNVVTEMDSNIIIILQLEKNLALLQNESQSSSGGSSEADTLTKWIKKIQKNNPGAQVTLLIQGVESYIRKVQKNAQKEFRNRILNAENPSNGKRNRKGNPTVAIQMTRTDIQSTLIGVQLHTRINYRFFENNSELSIVLSQYVKSIAEAPYKKEKMNSSEFDWYALSDCVGGIPVEDNGKGMRSLWVNQLCQFPMVGQESALAISRVYGSPKELYEAYRRCSDRNEAKDLLTNIKVTMGVGPLAKTRRLGPEASKKIYRFFTATDGERDISI